MPAAAQTQFQIFRSGSGCGWREDVDGDGDALPARNL